MIEIDRGGLKSVQQIEIAFSEGAEAPFKAARQGNNWTLQVDRVYFEARGFTDSEIEGASALEAERVAEQVSLDSSGAIAAFRGWRNLGKQDNQAQAFQTLFERLAALKALERRDPAKAELARQFLAKFSGGVGQSYPNQLFDRILSQELGHPAQVEPIIEQVNKGLSQEEEVEGRSVSPIDALSSPNLSFEAKQVWFQNRLMPWLDFLKAQENARKREEPTPLDPNQAENQPSPNPSQEPPPPPSASDEYEQHRGREEKVEGAPPIFKVEPYLGGYYESDSFDLVDEPSGRLIKSPTQRLQGQAIPLKAGPPGDELHRNISGMSGTNLFALPLTSAYQLTQQGLDNAKRLGIQIYADQEGHIFLKSSSNQPYEIEVGKNPNNLPKGIISRDTQVTEILTTEIEGELEKIKGLAATSVEKARVWQSFVHNFFTYPKDDQVESMYKNVDNQASLRLKAMVSGKLADCYLAREFFVAGLKRLEFSDLEWRSVNGYFVQGKARDGSAELHSGNAHAWAKVRLTGSKDWIILDPTPKGDPIKEKGDQQAESGENQMEQFQDSAPELLSEDDLNQIEKEAEERKSQEKSLTPDEQWLLEFTDQTGLPLEEARLLKETLDQTDQMTDSQGRNILKRIKEQIDKIIHRYTREDDRMVGLVRMSQGQELEDPVAARLDVRTGVLDPTGFNRIETVQQKEEVYGGFDSHLVVDGSGSMAEQLGGKPKYKEQQKMVYLFLRALHYFAQEAEKRKLRLVTPLAVRSGAVLFQGNKVEVVKPLSEEFTPPQMALLWKRLQENIGGRTPDHLGLQAVLEGITPEEVQLLQDKKLLKIVSLVRDGGSDNPAKVAELTQKLRDMNVIVADFLITDPNSLDQLPENIANQVIGGIGQLMPERITRKR